MKISILSALLLPVVVARAAKEDGPSARLAGCFFTKTFETGATLDAKGVANFKVVQGAEVRCYTACLSGGEFTTAYNFGSEPNGIDDEDSATENNQFCESTSKFTADADQTELGWSIKTDDDYTALALTCFWYVLVQDGWMRQRSYQSQPWVCLGGL